MRYHIDPSWYEEADRSLELMVWSRQCPGCQAKPTAQVKAAKGKKSLAPWKRMLANIEKECSKTDGYLAVSTPVMEAVFRLLLSHGNRALEDAELLELLREKGVLVGRGVDSVERLHRLLELDDHYGVVPVE